MSEAGTEYPPDFVDRLEILWGRGFLSPGGADEVKEIVRDVAVSGREVLDIGCGTGGPAIVLVNELNAGQVIAIDVEPDLLERARCNAHAAAVSDRIEFKLISPGPLPFPDNCFDVVFSKDAMIHIPDKATLFREVFRVLRPNGLFAASDWLAGDDTAPSPELTNFQQLAHLTFNFASAAETATAMKAAGFQDVYTRDRNRWYAALSRYEVDQIEGPLKDTILEVIDKDTYSRWVKVRRALADAVGAGALRPTQLRGLKPAGE